MTTHRGVRRSGVMALCLALAACGRREAPKADTTAIPLQAPTGALASRHECQSSLDAARTALHRMDADACIASLAHAATFFRAEAEAAPSDAQPSLTEAAEELETLVANIAKGTSRTSKDFERVFARANAAEAHLHLARARIALLKQEHVRAGEELLMTTDHLERATKDANLQRDSVVQMAIADARSLTSEMIRGMAIVPDEATKLTGEIEAAINRIVSTVYARPLPEPNERDD